MNLLKRIFNSLFGDPDNSLVLPDAMVFNSLNKEAIEKKLNILHRAKVNGEFENPNTNSTSPDSVELDIETEVMNLVRPVLQNYDSHQQTYKNRLNAINPDNLLNKIKDDAAKLKVELNYKVDQAKGELFSLKEELKEIETDWLNFKAEWKVTSDPIIKFSRFQKVSFLIFMVLIEAIINGSVLAPYSSGGLIEGFMLALIFPILTLIGVGLAAGNLLRLCYRRNPLWKKMMYFAFLFIFSIPAILLGLLLAYIRQYIEAEGDWETGYQIWLQVFNGSFHELSLTGLLLFLFSSVLFVIATFDIASFDHPIPGLLDKYQRRRQAHQYYRSRHKFFQDELLSLYKNGTGTSNNLTNNLKAYQFEYGNLVDSQLGLKSKLQNYIQHVEDVVNSLISKYREENQKNRKTESPSYFAERWSFKLLNYTTLINSDINRDTSQVYAKLHGEIRKIQDSLQKEFSKIPNEIESLKREILTESQ